AQSAEVVKGKWIEGRVDLGEHPERERVQLLRTVEHDRGDRALSTTEDLFVIHAGLIAPSGSTRPRRAWRFVTALVTFRYRRLSAPSECERSIRVCPWYDICSQRAQKGVIMESQARVIEATGTGDDHAPETALRSTSFDSL